jgi:hypothetical protein
VANPKNNNKLYAEELTVSQYGRAALPASKIDMTKADTNTLLDYNMTNNNMTFNTGG